MSSIQSSIIPSNINQKLAAVATNFVGDWFQNGGVESPMPSSPQVPISSNRARSKNVPFNDTSKRPNRLEVDPTMKYLSKMIRGDSDGGSLPSSPDQQSDSDSEAHCVCSGIDDVLENLTRSLIRQFMREYTGLSKPQMSESRELSTMKRVVDGLLEKHNIAYRGMVNKLSLETRGNDVSFVGPVAESLFGDGSTNWGRVASLVAFGAVVSKHMKEKGNKECVEQVAQEISTYLLSEQRDWLIKNNAWEGFSEFFHVADPESTVRNALFTIAGVAGIGATLALVFR